MIFFKNNLQEFNIQILNHKSHTLTQTTLLKRLLRII